MPAGNPFAYNVPGDPGSGLKGGTNPGGPAGGASPDVLSQLTSGGAPGGGLPGGGAPGLPGGGGAASQIDPRALLMLLQLLMQRGGGAVAPGAGGLPGAGMPSPGGAAPAAPGGGGAAPAVPGGRLGGGADVLSQLTGGR